MTPPGDIRAYDILTGKLLWQFHTIPRPGEFGYETNPTDGWKYIGGANNWGEMSIDEARGIVYIPTGSATADFWGADRHGQNLFANCILALDVRTGKRLWHFQTIHHDLWDLDNVSAPQLVTVRHNGQNVDVVAHAGKTGFLYVFNRVTGEPLWPIEERPVAKGDVPGEFYSPTQPFPTKPRAVRAAVVHGRRRQPAPADARAVQRAPRARAEREQRHRSAGWAVRADQAQRRLASRCRAIRAARTGARPRLTRSAGWSSSRASIRSRSSASTTSRIRRSADAARGGGGGNNNPPPNMSQVAVGQKVYAHVLRGLPRRRSAADDSRHSVARRCHRSHRPGEPARHRQRGPQQHAPDSRRDQRGHRGDSRLPHDHQPGGSWRRRSRPWRSADGSAARANVVASGGAPRPQLPARYGGPFFPGVGGTTGNVPWPADVEAAKLTKRYQSGYNVMATSTKPPYTTITAYDLNTGEIKWQVPNGDDPATVDNNGKGDGPHDTGGVGARNGMVVTRTGLLFQNGKDGWARAYDVETGKVLWKGKTAGQSIGIPTMYEHNGRQYVVFMSPPVAPGNVGGAQGGGTSAVPENPTGPHGYIAFALPR